jgi:putative transposase
MKSALERMLDTEMDLHRGRKAVAAFPPAEGAAVGPPAHPNRRHSDSQKTVSGKLGDLTLGTRRDNQLHTPTEV